MEFFVGLLFHSLIGLFILGSSAQAGIRGVPGVDYPNHYVIPVTSFNCLEQEYIPGIYADVETGCQVFHFCYEHRKESFLCPPGTIFNQPLLTCDYWYSSNCSLAQTYFNVNARHQNKLHANIPIVVKLHPDSSDETSHSTENLFPEMSLYSRNSQFSTESQPDGDLSPGHPNIEQNFEDTELEGEDPIDRKGRSTDNFHVSDVEDDSIPVGFVHRNLFSHGQEFTNENLHENNEDNNLYSFGISSRFYPELPVEKSEPGLSPYIDYKPSEAEYFEDDVEGEGRSIDFSEDNEEILNSDAADSKDTPQSALFTSFSKRFSQAERSPKRSRRKPLYIVSDDSKELNLPPKRQRTRGYPYVQPSESPDDTVATEDSDQLATDSVWNTESEFLVDSEEPEEMTILPKEASDILDPDNPLSEMDGSSFQSEWEERQFRTPSDLENLEETSARENLLDQSIVTESSVDPEPEAVFQDESNSNSDLDRMVSDEIPQEVYDANQDNQGVLPEDPDDTDVWIHSEDSDSQYIPESGFPEGLGDENSPDYEENYPLYFDYSYQPEIDGYNDNQYSVETEWNSEFRPYLSSKQKTKYVDSDTDYRRMETSNMYQRSWYQPYGNLRSLSSFQPDNTRSESLKHLRDRYIPELATGSSSYNSHSSFSKFIPPNPQYTRNENLFYPGSEGQNGDLQYTINMKEVDSFPKPSYTNVENYSEPIYALSDDPQYSSDQLLDAVNYFQVNGNLGEDVHLSSGMEDADSAEYHSQVSNRNILPSVDYVLPGKEHSGADVDGYISEYWQGEQIRKLSTEENMELNKPDAKNSKEYPRYVELLKKWEKIYLKSLEEYVSKSEKTFLNNSKAFQEREGDQMHEFKIPEDVRKQLARDAWEKLDPTGTTLCRISREDVSFKHLLTGKEITEDIREELAREAIKAVYNMCFAELEDHGELKIYSDGSIDFIKSRPNSELDKGYSDNGESEVIEGSEEFSHKSGKDMIGSFSFHEIGDEKSESEAEFDIPDQNDDVGAEFVHSDPPQDVGMSFSSPKMSQILDAEQVTEKIPLEALETDSVTHDSTKDLDHVLNVPVSTSEISGSDIFAKSSASSDGEQKLLQANFVPSNHHGKEKVPESSDPKKEFVFKSPLKFESSNNQEQSTFLPTSEQTFVPAPKPKVGKSIPKEIKQFEGSAVQFSNEVELLNQLALGNSKDISGQRFGNFPLELQQLQRYNSFPSSIQEILAGQEISGRPGAKAGIARSSSLPRRILSMKSQKLNLLKKYLNAIRSQR